MEKQKIRMMVMMTKTMTIMIYRFRNKIFQDKNSYEVIKELLSHYGYVNISPDEKSRKLISKDSITPISNFEEETNNYVWINPSKPVSWHFI